MPTTIPKTIHALLSQHPGKVAIRVESLEGQLLLSESSYNFV